MAHFPWRCSPLPLAPLPAETRYPWRTCWDGSGIGTTRSRENGSLLSRVCRPNQISRQRLVPALTEPYAWALSPWATAVSATGHAPDSEPTAGDGGRAKTYRTHPWRRASLRASLAVSAIPSHPRMLYGSGDGNRCP